MKSLPVFFAFALLADSAAAQDWATRALDESPRHAAWVKIKSAGRSLSAFVVYPEIKKKSPAIIVVHENFGLTDWARATADQFAARGYIAIAPDLLSGKGPFKDVDDTRKAVSALAHAEVMRDLDAVADYAARLPAASGRVSVAGFCWGGGEAFRFAAHRAGLHAAFIFNGPPPPDVSAVKAPVYGFYAGNDKTIAGTVADTVRAMKAARRRFEQMTYSDAEHGFMRSGEDPAGPQGDKVARVKAWRRLEWLLKQ